MDDWTNIAYLRQGTERQQAAFRTLLHIDIFTVLAAYDPVLVGTIPLNIDLPGSDLDILIYAPNFSALEEDLHAYYGHMLDFAIEQKVIAGVPTLLCHFLHQGFTIQIFAQDIPVEEQPAYRHLVVQARLLRLTSDEARRAIRALKQDRLDTESAFCRYFLIPGEPRQALLDLYDASIPELEELVIAAAHRREPFAVPE